MSIDVGQAARGGPEMGFWPLAVFTFIYADFLSLSDYAILVLLGFGGAVSFILIRRTQKLIPSKSTKETVRERVSREGVDRGGNSEKSIYEEAGFLILPDGPGKIILVGIGFLGNLIMGIWLLYKLTGDLVSSSSPSAAIAALLMLPFLYATVAISQYFW